MARAPPAQLELNTAMVQTSWTSEIACYESLMGIFQIPQSFQIVCLSICSQLDDNVYWAHFRSFEIIRKYQS